jgi:hypothetical protein
MRQFQIIDYREAYGYRPQSQLARPVRREDRGGSAWRSAPTSSTSAARRCLAATSRRASSASSCSIRSPCAEVLREPLGKLQASVIKPPQTLSPPSTGTAPGAIAPHDWRTYR